jgi:regulator of cell morphogenesis and NO signaling
VLFPMIRRLADTKTRPTFHCGPITNPISMMMLEHDRAGHLLVRLRGAANDYHVPADGCASYRACYRDLAELEADTHLHIHKENNVLFPAVVQLEDGLPINATTTQHDDRATHIQARPSSPIPDLDPRDRD